MRKYVASLFYKLRIVFLHAQRISRLRARPKGFPVALWKPSAPYAMKGMPVGSLEFRLSCIYMKNIFSTDGAAASIAAAPSKTEYANLFGLGQLLGQAQAHRQ